MARTCSEPLLAGVLALVAALAAPAAGAAAPADSTTDAIGRESPWPVTVEDGDTTLTVYQPQLDQWDGFKLEGRVAVQAAVGKTNPQVTYGIVSLEARTLTDKGTRVVTIDQAKVVGAEFPSAPNADTQRWANAIANDLAGKSRTIGLDQFESQLTVAYTASAAQRQPLRHEPPQIIFSRVPAMLIYVDGTPAYRAFSGTPYERVINTRPLVLRDKNGTHYLRVLDGWMSAPALNGPWTAVAKPAADLERAFKTASDARLVDPLTGQTTPDDPKPSLASGAPAIYVATAPTELIVTEGEPRYVPIASTQLLYVDNTTGNIFKDTSDNRTYVLVAGRWFRAASEQGPWEHVPADALPAGFASIPDDSAKENVKASIAGTDQAREAAIAASIPQTAAVKVSGTKLTPPTFDGEAKFETVEGNPDLEHVTNSATPILRVFRTTCYALENGVWFVSASVNGAWSVATSVPSIIYSIPPSSPLYYVTFVRIYGSEGDTVYEGYTPGYQGTYVEPTTTVVVYGTGYYYAPWTSVYWYGAPVTYGFGASVAYTPWTGWAVAFGIGWAWGTATVAWGWGWGPYPWWGPWGWGWSYGPAFYPWYPAWGGAIYGPRGGAAVWGPGGWAGYTGNVYQNWGNRASVSRGAGGYDAWTGNAWAAKSGISYNSRTGVASAGQRGAVGNIYSGNYATGGRGAAVGPNGGAAVGAGGTRGNIYTGNSVSGGRGAVYNPTTGQWTGVGAATGSRGNSAVRVGDDVYAGGNGNVYRRNDAGTWEKRSADGWQPIEPTSPIDRPDSGAGSGNRPGSGGGDAGNRPGAGGGAGSGGAQRPSAQPLPSTDYDRLNRDYQNRQSGQQRTQQLRQSSYGMHQSYGGRMGGGGGFRGGGGRR
jgi:hypothetical protein